jgi:heme-degrading monooxygenase HmoA
VRAAGAIQIARLGPEPGNSPEAATMTVHTTIWEFIVEPEQVDEFQRHYGAKGTWAELFARGEGYLQTLLLQDATDPRRFVTIDRWASAADYRAFRAQFSRAYSDLDIRCERLTAHETLVGNFDEPLG